MFWALLLGYAAFLMIGFLRDGYSLRHALGNTSLMSAPVVLVAGLSNPVLTFGPLRPWLGWILSGLTSAALLGIGVVLSDFDWRVWWPVGF